MTLRDHLFHEEPGVTLYCGDAREVLPMLGPFDALITDPPYGIGFGKYESHDDDPREYETLIQSVVFEAERHIECGYCCVMQAAATASRWSALLPREWRPIALPKTFVQMNMDKRMVWATDYALWWRIGETPLRQGVAPRDWFVCDTANMALKIRGHPCPRPLSGMAHLIACASEPGWMVVDPFAGSGTTLDAAKNLGRRAIGIEISPVYCEIAVKRLRQEVLPLKAEG